MKHILYSSHEKAAAAERAARGIHYEGEIARESFWKKAATSLPPRVQRKYGHLFEAAERYEPVIEFIVELFRRRRSDRAAAKGRSHRQVHA